MKILHCVSSLKVGGAEKLVKNLSLCQANSGSQVTILSFGNCDEEFQKELEKTNIIIINVHGNILQRQRLLLRIIQKFDILHIHSPAVIRAFIFIFPFLIRKKVFYTIHGEVAPDLSGMKVSHYIAQLYVSKTFAVSEQTRIKALELFGWPQDKIIVVKNGVSISANPRQFNLSGTLTLGVVARLIPLKRVEDLILCVSDMQGSSDSQIKVKIFGDGSERNMLEALVKKLALTESIKFCGTILNEEEIFSQFDCLIICSDTEGLPMSLLESMGSGVPCISTKVGAIPEVILASESGWLYDTGELLELSKHISHLLVDRGILTTKGLNAREYVKNNFSIDGVKNVYQQYYGGLK